jgi:hypothetical protein
MEKYIKSEIEQNNNKDDQKSIKKAIDIGSTNLMLEKRNKPSQAYQNKLPICPKNYPTI